ncbi:MAG: beta-glucosidase BglX [Hyphomonas sp.]|jgi:beta-glucosidase|nr:beta-glucosidase BglX [Hyphomonadaceae bacterium]MBL4877942.1 beta-glucosidase BglX [Hyphomonas sp.]|tara:strand:- start:83802 stop:85997 length:2196 start_codon:yes stop_codon:yes gene_type:complete
MAEEPAAIEARVESLLAQMTLEEKIGQLIQLSNVGDTTGPLPDDETRRRNMELVKAGMIGSMLNVVGVEEVRIVQDYAVNNSRLGIPLIFGFDVVHGHKTSFPIPLGEAASWDLELIEESARIAAAEAAAQGLNWTFAPMADISRDPRWGRVMEGAGEDPYLGAEIAVARVRGFQGSDLSRPDTIAATVKHFAGYGFSESGRDYNTVDFSSTTLFNVVLPPFRAAVKRANARTVMNAFNIVNGIPSTGNIFLQREILKGEWGFDGFVVSDWASGLEMINHGFAADEREAARLAMQAGSDMDMESSVYLEHLQDLVESGDVSLELIDDAVRRILRVKYELGLFDDPYRYLDESREAAVLLSPENLATARKVAERSIVLLKNDDHLLPLKRGETVALIGALAADKDSPLGNWRAMGESDSAVSVVDAFEAAGIDFTYAEGAVLEIGSAGFPDPVVVNTEDRSGFSEAVAAARGADKVVIVLGEDARQSGEGRSRTRLGFPGVQQELLEAVTRANPNTILVVMSGRPLVLSWADENLPTIVQAWHLGSDSGHALTNVLTGKYNPSGKLPMSFPRSVGQVPVYYNHFNTGRPDEIPDVFWSHFTDEKNTPLYPFGHGLSYTSFAYSDLSAVPEGETCSIEVTVANTGKVAGEEVVQLYIRDRAASVVRPVRELKGFQKILLQPGELKVLRFSLGPDELGFYNGDGEFLVEPGMFDIFVGGVSTADLSTSFSCEPR